MRAYDARKITGMLLILHMNLGLGEAASRLQHPGRMRSLEGWYGYANLTIIQAGVAARLPA